MHSSHFATSSEVGGVKNGSTCEAPQEFRPQSIPQGNSSPNIIIMLHEFNQAYAWIEKNTLISYFLVFIYSGSFLKDWIDKYWHLYGIHVDHVQNFTKGFFHFHFLALKNSNS